MQQLQCDNASSVNTAPGVATHPSLLYLSSYCQVPHAADHQPEMVQALETYLLKFDLRIISTILFTFRK